jgi:hypothetical protein
VILEATVTAERTMAASGVPYGVANNSFLIEV